MSEGTEFTNGDLDLIKGAADEREVDDEDDFRNEDEREVFFEIGFSITRILRSFLSFVSFNF